MKRYAIRTCTGGALTLLNDRGGMPETIDEAFLLTGKHHRRCHPPISVRQYVAYNMIRGKEPTVAAVFEFGPGDRESIHVLPDATPSHLDPSHAIDIVRDFLEFCIHEAPWGVVPKRGAEWRSWLDHAFTVIEDTDLLAFQVDNCLVRANLSVDGYNPQPDDSEDYT